MSSKLPHGILEEDFLAAVKRVTDKLANGFAFAYWTPEDIIQEAHVLALQALPQYKPGTFPLASFLYTHIKNRLCTLKRDKLIRLEAPCAKCHAAVADGRGRYCEGAEPCKKYREFLKRNRAKVNVTLPTDISNIRDHEEPGMRDESTVVEDLAQRELLQKIDRELPVAMRADYLRMRAGCEVLPERRAAVEQVVMEIVGCLDGADSHEAK